MSKRSSPRKKKGAKDDKVAKIHRITGRHAEEIKMAHYIKRLDKIYSDLNMAHMVPKVVQKMRTQYSDNPHALYLKVCHKWGVTPKPKFDQHLLAYGKASKDKFKPKVEKKDQEDSSKERDTESKTSDLRLKFDFKDDSRQLSPEIVTQSPRRAKMVERMYQPRSYQKRVSPRREFNERRSPSTSPRLSPRNKIEYVHTRAGDIVETMVLTNSNQNQETGFWIGARILSINTEKETMDLEVLEPKKYGLSQLAKDVPHRYVRARAKMMWRN